MSGLRRWIATLAVPQHSIVARFKVCAGLLVGLVLVGWCGCAHLPTVTPEERLGIYARKDVHFDRTILLKPAESSHPEFRFAPLLVQEVISTNKAPAMPHSVYSWRTRALAVDGVMEQINYLWFHPGNAQGTRIPQGVRITFDRPGQPVLWEILRDPTGARILFVSQSFEAVAMTSYPTPLPGRRFWVEQAVEDVPTIVVARILDEAPADMGPIVYLKHGSHDVSTVICRCMDAQAKEVVGACDYGLAPLGDEVVRWLSRDKTPGITRWLPGMPPDDLPGWFRVAFR